MKTKGFFVPAESEDFSDGGFINLNNVEYIKFNQGSEEREKSAQVFFVNDDSLSITDKKVVDLLEQWVKGNMLQVIEEDNDPSSIISTYTTIKDDQGNTVDLSIIDTFTPFVHDRDNSTQYLLSFNVSGDTRNLIVKNKESVDIIKKYLYEKKGIST